MSFSAPLARAPADAALAHGAHITLTCGGVVTRGRVAYVENGWVYWVDADARVHASPLGAVEVVP